MYTRQLGDMPMHATKFVRSYFDAWNQRDPKAVAGHLAADGIYCDIPENVQRSRDELIVNLREFFSDYRHRYELIGDILKGRNTIAFQYRMCPRRRGAKDESAAAILGAECMTLRGDAAMTIIDYYEIPGAAQRSQLAGLASARAQTPKYGEVRPRQRTTGRVQSPARRGDAVATGVSAARSDIATTRQSGGLFGQPPVAGYQLRIRHEFLRLCEINTGLTMPRTCSPNSAARAARC